MGKTVQEYVTFWGPSINEWEDDTNKPFRGGPRRGPLQKGARGVARKMEKISLDQIVDAQETSPLASTSSMATCPWFSLQMTTSLSRLQPATGSKVVGSQPGRRRVLFPI